ncbi:YrhB domain-containing protein [Runella aurantiaca]|nr:hypothetical protein [Runella aurantiaca]
MKRYWLYLMLIAVCQTYCVGQKKQQKLSKNKMVDYYQARTIALEKMATFSPAKDIVLWEEKTITKPYGWIFIFTTEKYIETRNPNDTRPGTPAIIVEYQTGLATETPSSVPLETFLREFEKKFQPKY